MLPIELLFATINFIKRTVFWKDIVKIVLGNIVMFIPCGFLDWIFTKLKD